MVTVTTREEARRVEPRKLQRTLQREGVGVGEQNCAIRHTRVIGVATARATVDEIWAEAHLAHPGFQHGIAGTSTDDSACRASATTVDPAARSRRGAAALLRHPAVRHSCRRRPPVADLGAQLRQPASTPDVLAQHGRGARPAVQRARVAVARPGPTASSGGADRGDPRADLNSNKIQHLLGPLVLPPQRPAAVGQAEFPPCTARRRGLPVQGQARRGAGRQGDGRLPRAVRVGVPNLQAFLASRTLLLPLRRPTRSPRARRAALPLPAARRCRRAPRAAGARRRGRRRRRPPPPPPRAALVAARPPRPPPSGAPSARLDALRKIDRMCRPSSTCRWAPRVLGGDPRPNELASCARAAGGGCDRHGLIFHTKNMMTHAAPRGGQPAASLPRAPTPPRSRRCWASPLEPPLPPLSSARAPTAPARRGLARGEGGGEGGARGHRGEQAAQPRGGGGGGGGNHYGMTPKNAPSANFGGDKAGKFIFYRGMKLLFSSGNVVLVRRQTLGSTPRTSVPRQPPRRRRDRAAEAAMAAAAAACAIGAPSTTISTSTSRRARLEPLPPPLQPLPAREEDDLKWDVHRPPPHLRAVGAPPMTVGADDLDAFEFTSLFDKLRTKDVEEVVKRAKGTVGRHRRDLGSSHDYVRALDGSCAGSVAVTPPPDADGSDGGGSGSLTLMAGTTSSASRARAQYAGEWAVGVLGGGSTQQAEEALQHPWWPTSNSTSSPKGTADEVAAEVRRPRQTAAQTTLSSRAAVAARGEGGGEAAARPACCARPRARQRLPTSPTRHRDDLIFMFRQLGVLFPQWWIPSCTRLLLPEMPLADAANARVPRSAATCAPLAEIMEDIEVRRTRRRSWTTGRAPSRVRGRRA